MKSKNQTSKTTLRGVDVKISITNFFSFTTTDYCILFKEDPSEKVTITKPL